MNNVLDTPDAAESRHRCLAQNAQDGKVDWAERHPTWFQVCSSSSQTVPVLYGENNNNQKFELCYLYLQVWETEMMENNRTRFNNAERM